MAGLLVRFPGEAGGFAGAVGNVVDRHRQFLDVGGDCRGGGALDRRRFVDHLHRVVEGFGGFEHLAGPA
ncbi:hypothetical protein SDC9_138430 [bioreactor metagenome]|uniref:Uncharacterized protein n=1 Tax=bioreactor metagenome TaxID=1076179 RepID=A0A645DS64_9ZZZZ